MQRPLTIWMASLVLWLPAGCDAPKSDNDEAGDDDSSGTDPDEDGDEEDDGAEDDEGGDLECHDALRHGPVQLGGACRNDLECHSFFCERYETFGPEGEGQCAEPPPSCLSRSMGSLKDAVTDEPVVGATMYFGPATEVVTNPNTATRLAETVTDARGHFDMTSEAPVDSFYAVLGAALSDQHEPSVGFLAFPIDDQNNYAPAFGVRDFFAVKTSDLEVWNQALADDTEVAPYLPIEDRASVVTVIASYDFEEKRVAGVTVTPLDAESDAVIRYLNEDGTTFNATATSSNGVVLLLGAKTGERFDANSADLKIWDPEIGGRPGTVQNGVYAMLILMSPR